MRSRILGVMVLWLLAGCSHEARIRPAPSPQVVVSSDGRIAAAEDNGVRLVASADTWRGHPADLQNTLTPVEIVLENNSGRDLRVQYDGFELVGQSHYVALLPNSLGRPTTARGPSTPPTYNPYGNFGREPQQVCLTCPPAGSSGLPTVDMLNQAFPEGLLKNEASFSGFLYFELLGTQERQVTLQARLVDAKSGEVFGTLRIPFTVRDSSR